MEEFILRPTGDKSDRAPEIEKLLQEKHVCILSAGTFFVSGVKMPPHSTLCGLGEATTVILLEEVEEGTAVSMNDRCSVKNLTFLGAEGEMPRPETLGKRNAIGFIGDAVKKDDCARQIKDGAIDACNVYSFSGGGIYCLDTGYNVSCCLSATNCHIHNCGAGIYIPHFSEYHKFTNIVCTRNLYGCINNGGNNVFTACAFDGNTEGFLIDNSDGLAKNNAHGSAVACTFNHTNQNEGVGIRILGSAPGFVFSACQLFFSKIVVENSGGIQFDHFNCGRGVSITVKGGGGGGSALCFRESPSGCGAYHPS